MTTRWALLLILAAAVLIWSPTLLVASPGDSFGYTLNWSAQFTRAFLQGNPYPRWTAASFGGLGAPTFYFYPPLPFWTAAIASAPLRAVLSAADQAKLAVLAFLALSGLSMFAWLRTRAAATASLAGALVYMVMPYHLDDHYVRGAFAEFAAFAVTPLLGLGLAWSASGRRFGVAALGAGWGGLILCHLPTALLAGALMVVPYGAFLLWRARGARTAAAVRMALGLSASLAVAAVYLIPSLLLQNAVSAGYWWRFQVGVHLFANPASWGEPLDPFFGAFSLAFAALAAAIGWRAWRVREGQALFWAALVIGLFLVMAGLIPFFWSLPLMAKAQFPWRAMALQDFAFATLIAWSSRFGRTPMIGVVTTALIVGNGLALARDLAHPGPAQPRYGAATFPTTSDAPEYLPAGMLKMTPDGPTLAVAYGALVARPLAIGPVLRASEDEVSGAVSLQLAPGSGGLIVLRRFYFPAWRVRCDGAPVAAFPTSDTRLLSFNAPPTARACEAAIGATPPEQLGAALSALGLVLLIGYSLHETRLALRSAQARARGAAAA